MCIPSEIYAFQGPVNPDAKGEECHTLTAASTSLFLLKSDWNRAPGLRFSPFLLMAKRYDGQCRREAETLLRTIHTRCLRRIPGICSLCNCSLFFPSCWW